MKQTNERQGAATRNSKAAQTVKQQGRAITVRIAGAQYATLERAAQALNACEWCDNDNTALTVFRDFLWSWFSRYVNRYGDLARLICEDIETGAAGRVKRARLDRLARVLDLHAAVGV